MSEQERATGDDAPAPELRAMIDEVRSTSPQLDWERLEARLFDADGNVHEHSGVQRLSPPAPIALPTPKTSRYAAVSAGLALAAAFALAILSPTRAVDTTASKPSAPQVAVARAPMLGDDGQPVAVGQRIVASSGAWLRSNGRVTIHLEPGTVATVLDLGERVHLSLESGAVSADVVPVAGGEPFAVDVAGRRVAVHGTRLRVALLGQSVQVAVAEGSAVVGLPHGGGRTEGTLVHFGNVGRFDAPSAPGFVTSDAALASKLVDQGLAVPAKTAPTVAVETHAAPPAHELLHPAVHPSKAAVVEPSAPEPTVAVAPAAPKPGLTAEQLSGPLSKLAPSLQTCARKSSKGVVFENEQDLTIEISPTGKATLLSAEPGLDTPDRGCWSMVVSALTFPTAEGSTTVKRHVVVGSP